MKLTITRAGDGFLISATGWQPVFLSDKEKAIKFIGFIARKIVYLSEKEVDYDKNRLDITNQYLTDLI